MRIGRVLFFLAIFSIPVFAEYPTGAIDRCACGPVIGQEGLIRMYSYENRQYTPVSEPKPGELSFNSCAVFLPEFGPRCQEFLGILDKNEEGQLYVRHPNGNSLQNTNEKELIEALKQAPREDRVAFVKLVAERSAVLVVAEPKRSTQLFGAIDLLVAALELDHTDDDVKEAISPMLTALGNFNVRVALLRRLISRTNQLIGAMKSLLDASPLTSGVDVIRNFFGANSALGILDAPYNRVVQEVEGFRRDWNRDIDREPFRFLTRYRRAANALKEFNIAAANALNQYASEYGATRAYAAFATSVPLMPFGVGFVLLGGAATTATVYLGSGASLRETLAATLAHVVGVLAGYGIFKGASPLFLKLIGSRTLAYTLSGGVSGGLSMPLAGNAGSLVARGELLKLEETLKLVVVGFSFGAAGGFLYAIVTRGATPPTENLNLDPTRGRGFRLLDWLARDSDFDLLAYDPDGAGMAGTYKGELVHISPLGKVTPINGAQFDLLFPSAMTNPINAAPSTVTTSGASGTGSISVVDPPTIPGGGTQALNR